MQDKSKDIVISLLLKENSLSLSAINDRLKVMNKNFSYHTTYKSIRKLLSDGVIEKKGSDYTISPEWAKEKVQYLEDVNKFLNNQGLAQEDVTITELKDIMELNKFLRSIEAAHLARVDKNKNQTIIWAVYHCYNYLLQPAEELAYIKKLKDANIDFRVLCYGNTPLDNWTKKAFDKFGVTMRINAKVGGLTGFNIYDDLIVQTFFGQEFLNVLQQVYKSTQSINDLDLSDLFERLSKIKYTIHAVTYRDPKIISNLRGRALSFFN